MTTTAGKVAPHVGCEVRLVLGGGKPLATIEKDKDPSGYAMAICLIGAGMLRGMVSPTTDCPTGEVVFTKPGGSALLERYRWLQEFGVKHYGLKKYHREMGKLFGYTPEDIEAFIKSDVHCDCSKCTGKTNS